MLFAETVAAKGTAFFGLSFYFWFHYSQSFWAIPIVKSDQAMGTRIFHTIRKKNKQRGQIQKIHSVWKEWEAVVHSLPSSFPHPKRTLPVEHSSTLDAASPISFMAVSNCTSISGTDSALKNGVENVKKNSGSSTLHIKNYCWGVTIFRIQSISWTTAGF